MEDRMETVRGLAGKIKEKYWPPGKDQLLILVLVGLLLAVIAIPVEKKGTADEISRREGDEQWHDGKFFWEWKFICG